MDTFNASAPPRPLTLSLSLLLYPLLKPQLQAEAPNHRERATPSSSSSSKSSSHRGGGQEEDGCRRRKQKARRKPSARTEANQNGDHHDQEEEKEERECARAEGQRQRQGVGGVQDEVSASPRGPRQKMWRALRTLCGRIFRNRWGGRSGEVSASGEAEAKARIMKEFREVVGRHPGELRRRAREVRHELDDGMLVRWLKYVYAQVVRSVNLSRSRSAPS